MAGLADAVYAKLPTPLQHVAVSAFGLSWNRKRFGGIFRREVAGFIRRESFSPEQWRTYQQERLREVLTLAMSRVSYYRRAYAELGLTRERIARFTLDDLRDLPLLEKDEVRARPLDFVVDGRPPRGATLCPTSGSTGTPVAAWYTNADFQRSLALRETRSCRPAGVSFSEPRATFSGRLVVSDPESRGPFHRYNWIEKQAYFSSFHLSPANAPQYVEELRRHGTVWITSYTHVCHQLALMIREQRLSPPSTLRAIITTSEKLTPAAKGQIEEAFECPVFEEYGAVEDAFFASAHADGRLRVSPDAGILEVLREDGEPAAPGEPGEVVVTGFIRRSQPLIRYRLGDVATWAEERYAGPTHLPILEEVVGRLEDVVITPDGRRTVRFHAVFTELPTVREGQVIQEARDKLRIKVVPTAGFGPDTVDEITARVHARLSKAMNVEVEAVDSIPRTKAGKFKAVINLVDRP